MRKFTQVAAIRDVATEPLSWDPRRAPPGSSFRYVDISGVDSAEKRITSVATVVASRAPSRARQLLKAGDVLVSTVRPNLNGVAIVPAGLDGATASTGFAVLRSRPEKVDAAYLYYWVRSAAFVREMTSRATGASYPAVTERAIRDSKLPLPPLAEQRRIAELLDTASGFRTSSRARINELERFVSSAFLRFFGDPLRNERDWPTCLASEVIGAIDAGSSVGGEQRPRGPNEWAVLKISAVTSGVYRPEECKVVAHPPQVIVAPKRGDLLFSRANTRELVAATCLVHETDPNVFLPDKLWRITPKPDVAEAAYLHYLIANPGFRQRLTRQATGTSGSMLNVSQDKLLRQEVPLPPLDLQRRFAALAWRALDVRDKALGAADMADALTASLSESLLHERTA